MRLFLILIAVLCTNNSFIHSESLNCKDEKIGEECRKIKLSCAQCLQHNACCSWNYANDEDNRCDISDNFKDKNQSCIEHGGVSSVTILENKDLTDTVGDGQAVQLKPQRLLLKLRKGDPVDFKITYRAAKNYPIELYYLLDLTHSMVNHKNTLVKMGQELSQLLKTLSENYRIAFGYYSDKVAMPFYKMVEEDVNNPCNSFGQTCSKGFAFIHAHNFSKDTTEFIKRVNQSEFTSNLDDLEGGLEAVMQILQCNKKVQWMKYANKIIVMASNSILHLAGDGILAGVTARNSGNKCLLNERGVLEKYLDYDYPSLEEVYRQLKKKKVKLLFTAANNNDSKNYYKAMNLAISDVTEYVNNKDIIDSIRDGYDKIKEKISLSQPQVDYLDITFKSSCNTEEYKTNMNITSYCGNVKIGREYEFLITVNLKYIPENLSRTTITISEASIEEDVTIDIEFIGAYDGITDKNCSFHGKWKCGACSCEKEWTGDKCDIKCDIDSCRLKNSTYTSTICNSNGDCDCGCICDNDFSGLFCEFPNCPSNSAGLLCSGQGSCNRGQCECNQGFTGPVCDCPTTRDTCYRPGSSVQCSGHGYCECGKCICPKPQLLNDTTTLQYRGEYCQYCQNCGDDDYCLQYKECVLAAVDGRDGHGVVREMECPRNGTLEENKERKYGEFACRETYINRDQRTCTVIYEVPDDKDNSSYDLIFYMDGGCVEVARAGTTFYSLLITIATLLIASIVMLVVWKLMVSRKDQAEFRAYEENLKAGGRFETNELYKSPLVMYENPMRRVENGTTTSL